MNDTPEVIHLIFKTHLDIGFTDFAANVVARYFDDYIPRAIAVADELRARGGPERFRWTTGAWLIAEYLERAAPADQARMERAIRAGDILWHALPCTFHSELMDAELFSFGLGLAAGLDRRFGRRTIAAKMTDVPGHTRAIVPLLARAGVRFLHIGVNASSTPPDVPPVFVWRDPSGAEIVVMYQRGGYGDLVTVPGMRDALAFAHTNDNLGPQSAEEAIEQFVALQNRFPRAQVIASTMDDFAARLVEAKDRLPVLTGELGDTWVHGAGSDPRKLAEFRELCRLRHGWVAGGLPGDGPELRDFSRALLLVPEHTWGLDVKTFLPDTASYARPAFDAARAGASFRMMEDSWAEQRAYLTSAVAALPPELAQQARAGLGQLAPARPSRAGLAPLAAGQRVEGARLSIAIDSETGAIAELSDRASGRAWAAPGHPLALLRYQTFGQADYDRFRRQYSINKRSTAHWAIPDFTKPGIAAAGAEPRWWLPRLAGLHHGRAAAGDRILAELELPAEASERYGAPRAATLEIELPDAEPVIYLTLQWFDKPASRLPEALWLTFAPPGLQPRGWTLDKLGQPIDPLEVVRDGNRRLHAVGRGAAYQDARGRLELETLDAPLIAPGEPSLLNFTNRQPPLRQGMHVNLYNNVWGTNFGMWYGEDARFRFALRF